MQFNSLDFAWFLPVVFGLYWFAAGRSRKAQNGLLVAASLLFYGWWDYRFLSLLILSTAIDFWVALALARVQNPLGRRGLLWVSLVANLGMLGFFKYANFFLESFSAAFTFFGRDLRCDSLNIVLPVGISFYTFQTLSYTIDVYRRKLEPTRDFIAFAAFVSFFPQLVAGPIERASHLLGQFAVPRRFDYGRAVDGLRQMLWGLFKKVVVADGCAVYANQIFDRSGEYGGSTLLLGAFFFAVQIYGDFSGYSDIAIGTARLFGFDLMRNFAFPYFSRDVAEFWRRWHISLSTWFRDYLYIPLGGSRGGLGMKVRNLFIIFLVSGFWHGANWTFVAWGALHALYFLPLLIRNTNRNHLETVAAGRWLPSLKECFQMAATFVLVLFAWIFFRAASIGHALSYIQGILSPSLLSWPTVCPGATLALVAGFTGVEWLGRSQSHALATLGIHWPRPLRWACYYALVVAIAWCGNKDQQFIYFQF